MSLVESQRALEAALWGKIGHTNLDTHENWSDFIKAAPYGKLLDGLKREKLALYENLLGNTVQETLSTFFPFCRMLLNDQWYSLAEEYRRTYPNKSFQLYLCAQDFPEFLANKPPLMAQYPFIAELATYEWLEVEVENAPTQNLPALFTRSVPQTVDALSRTRPVWNTVADFRAWTYAIPALTDRLSEYVNNDNGGQHSLGNLARGFAPGEAPVLLFIYRDPETHRARYFELNFLAAQLLALGSTQESLSYLDLFKTLKASSAQLMDFSLEQVLNDGLGLCRQCHQDGILLGSIPS